MTSTIKTEVRAAIYARYTTENQRKESVEDQFRECEDLAAKEGLTVVAHFHDDAKSAGTAQRAGYQQMLAAARRHEFDILITEEIERLWRNRAEFGPRSAELEDLGIHWISCVGDDTRRDGWGVMIQIKQAMGEHARKQASYRTRRGLRGKAEKGKSTGGKAFGYTSVPDPSGERNRDGTPVMVKVVDEEKAKIVVQIYKWRAEGWSGQRIARQLNEDRVPPPGSSWKRTSTGPNRKNTAHGWTHSCIVGDPKHGTGILNNPTYRGLVRWGRTEWTPTASDSSVRVVKPATGQIVEYTDERLRIVTDELWAKVHAIQTATNPRREAVRLGMKKRVFRSRSKYLLGSTLVCGECGSNLIGDSRNDYICPAHTSNNCTNDMRFRRQDIHDAVFDLLTEHLLSKETMARGREQIEARLREEQEREEEALAAVADSKAMVRLDEQAAALRKMNLPPTALHAALSALDREREDLLKETAKKAAAPTQRAKRLLTQLHEIAAHYQKLVAQGVKALAKHEAVIEANEALRSLLVDGRITLVANANHSGVVGTVHFKGLGDHVLEMAGWTRRVGSRKPSEINKKLSGSGGRI